MAIENVGGIDAVMTDIWKTREDILSGDYSIADYSIDREKAGHEFILEGKRMELESYSQEEQLRALKDIESVILWKRNFPAKRIRKLYFVACWIVLDAKTGYAPRGIKWPDHIGIWEYLWHFLKAREIIADNPSLNDERILRRAGIISSAAGKEDKPQVAEMVWKKQPGTEEILEDVRRAYRDIKEEFEREKRKNDLKSKICMACIVLIAFGQILTNLSKILR